MLQNKIVAITGAAGFLGSSLAQAVVRQGGRVVMCDVNKIQGSVLEEKLGKDNSVFITADATDPVAIDLFLDAGVNRFGRIDAAVHCAYPRSKQWGTRFENLKPECLAEDLHFQLGGAILFSQRVISRFRQQNYGNLIHVSSIQGVAAPKFEHYEGTSMVSPIEYSAIKAGIISVTKYLAKYCRDQNIRVNCISPGGLIDKQPESFLQRYRDTCLSKGMLDADDLTGSLVFLLSDQSIFINGQNLIIDDGWSL